MRRGDGRGFTRGGPRGGRKALMILFFVTAGISLFTFIVMSLWNAILPDVLHVSPINFWQAMGILVLSKILFGGFGGWRHNKHKWKEKMQNKWEGMTDEEREQLKARMKSRFARWCQPDEQKTTAFKRQPDAE
jgi:hypothetical protein